MWPPSLAWYSSDSAQHSRSDGHRATGFENADELGDRLAVLGHVLEDLGSDDTVECAVGERQLERITLDRLGSRRRGCLALLLHRLQDFVDVVQVACVLVEGDDVGTAPERLEGVPTLPAADIDDLRARADLQPVEVDGQHWPTRVRARS